MKNLWKNNFDTQPTDTPRDIVQFQCDSLGEITGGIIVAKVEEYSEPIVSHSVMSAYDNITLINKAAQTVREFNVQDTLGEVADGKFRYEFYISSAASPNYKYRVLFLQFGVSMYPVTIVMDEDIAEELKLNYQISCTGQDEFEATLEAIINSKKVGKVVSSLLGMAKKERKASV
jgi:hypothetical protein